MLTGVKETWSFLDKEECSHPLALLLMPHIGLSVDWLIWNSGSSLGRETSLPLYPSQMDNGQTWVDFVPSHKKPASPLIRTGLRVDTWDVIETTSWILPHWLLPLTIVTDHSETLREVAVNIVKLEFMNKSSVLDSIASCKVSWNHNKLMSKQVPLSRRIQIIKSL